MAAKLADKMPKAYDSADDLDGYISDDAPIKSQKIPESQVKMNTELFAASNANSQIGAQDARDLRKESPIEERNVNQKGKKSGYANADDNEGLKKILYQKSPKEVASEYIHSSRQQQSYQSQQKSKTGYSPKGQKKFPYPFNTGGRDEEAENYNNSNLQRSQNLKPSAYTELSNKLFNEKMYGGPNGRQTGLVVGGGDPSGSQKIALSPNEARRIEEKYEKASKYEQESQADRLIALGRVIEEHNKALTNDYLQKEMEVCTFNPKTSNTDKVRSLEEFMEGQKAFVEKVESKKKKMLEEKEKKEKEAEGTYKPAVCKGSLKILEKKKEKGEKDISVHHRLYQVSRNSHAKHLQSVAENDRIGDDLDSQQSSQFIGPITVQNGRAATQESRDGVTFKPQIQKKSQNLKRNDKVENILYEDAIRRQHKSIETSRMKPKTETKAMSSSSKRALATRFIKEFDLAIVDHLEAGKPPKLDYVQLNEFLRKLRFMKESEQVDSPNFTPERILLYDMWYTLQADKFKGIHRRNLLVFSLAVLGLHYQITKIQKPEENQNDVSQQSNNDREVSKHSQSNFINPSLPEAAPRERKNIGNFDEEGNYELSEDEVRRIHKAYEVWHVNRLCSYDNIGQMISARKIEEAPYQPEICEVSRNIAQNFREKILEETANLIQQNKLAPPKDGKITHVDLLILSKKVTKEKTERLAERLIEEEAKSCTFKPDTIDYVVEGAEQSQLENSSDQPRKNAMPTQALGKNRALELYSLHKPRTLKKDKDKHEIEYEKNCDECTFQPNISTTKNSKVHTQNPTEYYAKGVDKTIERLRAARNDREIQLLQQERGFSNGTEGTFVFSVDREVYKTNASIDRITRKPKQEASVQESQPRDHSGYSKKSEKTSNAQRSNLKDDRNEEGDIDYDRYQAPEKNYGNVNNQNGDREHAPEDHEDGNQGDDEHEEAEGQGEEAEGDGEGQGEEGEQGEGEGEGEHEGEEGDERVPLLFVDVNLGQGRAERIVVYEGDKSDDLAHRFAEEHGLDPSMKEKLKELLDSQIAGLLSRIDEEVNSGHSETERANHSGNIHPEQINEEDEEDGSYRKSRK